MKNRTIITVPNLNILLFFFFSLKCQGQESCFNPEPKFPILYPIQKPTSQTAHLKYILHRGMHTFSFHVDFTILKHTHWEINEKISSVLWTVAAKSVFFMSYKWIPLSCWNGIQYLHAFKFTINIYRTSRWMPVI